jgi:hypothetical protein
MLLSEDSLFVVNNFSFQNIRGTKVDTITFDTSQKEAIDMDSNGKIFICEEAENGGLNKMYSLNLPQALSSCFPENSSVSVVRKGDCIELKNASEAPIKTEIYSYAGKFLDTIILNASYNYPIKNSNPLIFRSKDFAVLK